MSPRIPYAEARARSLANPSARPKGRAAGGLECWPRLSPSFRFGGAPPGWAGPLAAAKAVRLAMICDDWLAVTDARTGQVNAVPESWVRIGKLVLGVPKGYLGAAEVSFYATDEEWVPELWERLRAHAATLPGGVVFNFEPMETR